MPRHSRLPRLRSTGLALVVVASAFALTGCTEPAPDPGPSTPASEAPVASDGAAATPEPTPAEEPVPFEVDCATLLSADELYAYNPNYGEAPDFEPTAAGVVGVADEAGTTCGLLNQTSGTLIEFGVATPPPGALESRKNAAALGSKAVPTYGTPPEIEGYFSAASAGEAQVFTGEYWVVVASTDFIEPGDPQALVAAILANLPEAS